MKESEYLPKEKYPSRRQLLNNLAKGAGIGAGILLLNELINPQDKTQNIDMIVNQLSQEFQVAPWALLNELKQLHQKPEGSALTLTHPKTQRKYQIFFSEGKLKIEENNSRI